MDRTVDRDTGDEPYPGLEEIITYRRIVHAEAEIIKTAFLAEQTDEPIKFRIIDHQGLADIDRHKDSLLVMPDEMPLLITRTIRIGKQCKRDRTLAVPLGLGPADYPDITRTDIFRDPDLATRDISAVPKIHLKIILREIKP